MFLLNCWANVKQGYFPRLERSLFKPKNDLNAEKKKAWCLPLFQWAWPGRWLLNVVARRGIERILPRFIHLQVRYIFRCSINSFSSSLYCIPPLLNIQYWSKGLTLGSFIMEPNTSGLFCYLLSQDITKQKWNISTWGFLSLTFKCTDNIRLTWTHCRP